MMNTSNIFRVFVLALLMSLSLTIAADPDALKPEGKFVLMGDYRLYYHCQGEGEKTVIIDTGIGDSSANWLNIARQLSFETRICIYDRAGYGMSDPGPSPRSTAIIVEELYTLIQKAEIPGPYILVGHSYGGFTAQYFASVLPEETAGVLLVESSHPDQVKRLSELDTMKGAKRKKLINLPNRGIDYLTKEQEFWTMLNSKRKAIYAQMEELRAFKQSAEELHAINPFPREVPLVVLSRGRSQLPAIEGKYSLESIWQEMQFQLVSLSENSWHEVIRESGHSIHLEAPEAVVRNIRRLLQWNKGNHIKTAKTDACMSVSPDNC